MIFLWLNLFEFHGYFVIIIWWILTLAHIRGVQKNTPVDPRKDFVLYKFDLHVFLCLWLSFHYSLVLPAHIRSVRNVPVDPRKISIVSEIFPLFQFLWLFRYYCLMTIDWSYLRTFEGYGMSPSTHAKTFFGLVLTEVESSDFKLFVLDLQLFLLLTFLSHWERGGGIELYW